VVLALVNRGSRRQADQAARDLLGDRTASGTVAISRQVRLALDGVDRRLQRPWNDLQPTPARLTQQLTLLFDQRGKVIERFLRAGAGRLQASDPSQGVGIIGAV